MFRFDEFQRAHLAGGSSAETTAAALRYHVRNGRLRSLRRGLYASPGPLDPWVLGSRLASDAVLAYDGALSFHGLTGLGHGISFLTRQRVSRFELSDVVYLPVAPSARLARRNDLGGALMRAEREGQGLTVTTRERTFVDLLDRLDLGPGPRKLWKCLLEAGELDLDLMVRYARVLGRRRVAARLGFFLQRRKGTPAAVLGALQRLSPRSPVYFDRDRRSPGDPYFSDWRLVVPRRLVETVEDPSIPVDDYGLDEEW